MVWRAPDEAGERAVPRRDGSVLLIYDRQWRDEYGLLPVSDPIPVDEWLAETRRARYAVDWTPLGAIDAGPYRGGAVVEIADERGRSYAAVPPECLDRLQEIMDVDDYRMVREDVAALDNPEAAGMHVTRLDADAWEGRREVVPTDELSTEAWARSIRDGNLRLDMAGGLSLPLESRWPGGHVVSVCDMMGHSYYFAVPREALPFTIELAVEMDRRARQDRQGSGV